jgi:RNA polymerase sigma factor (sigma-70 family)
MTKKINLQKMLAQSTNDILLNNFLKLEINQSLLEQYKSTPTLKISESIQKNLHNYFIYVLLTSFIKKTLYYKSIHIKQRELARIHHLVPEDSLMFERLPDEAINHIDQSGLNWTNLIDTPELLDALYSLTKKQRVVLTSIYILGNSQKQTAQTLQVSPQNVFKIHKKALYNLKEYLNKHHEI